MRVFRKQLVSMVSLAAFALVGCEGGGPQEGLPKEGERTVSPEMQNQMKINMTPTKPSEIAKKKSEADKTTKAAEAK